MLLTTPLWVHAAPSSLCVGLFNRIWLVPIYVSLILIEHGFLTCSTAYNVRALKFASIRSLLIMFHSYSPFSSLDKKNIFPRISSRGRFIFPLCPLWECLSHHGPLPLPHLCTNKQQLHFKNKLKGESRERSQQCCCTHAGSQIGKRY